MENSSKAQPKRVENKIRKTRKAPQRLPFESIIKKHLSKAKGINSKKSGKQPQTKLFSYKYSRIPQRPLARPKKWQKNTREVRCTWGGYFSHIQRPSGHFPILDLPKRTLEKMTKPIPQKGTQKWGQNGQTWFPQRYLSILSKAQNGPNITKQKFAKPRPWVSWICLRTLEKIKNNPQKVP